MSAKLSGMQKMFNKVVRHVHRQGNAAVSFYGNQCMYRAPGGLECAAGCLIPNKMYRKDFEGSNIDVILCKSSGKRLWNHWNRLYGMNTKSIDLLADLQYAHDNNLAVYGRESFDTLIRELADSYGLKVPKSTWAS